MRYNTSLMINMKQKLMILSTIVIIFSLSLCGCIQDQKDDLSIKLLEFISKTPLKTINNISLFYIDFDIDIKLLSNMLNLFPQDSVIIVKIEFNKLRLLSLSDLIDANKTLKILINEYGGKGGGNPKSAQAYLEKVPKDLLLKIESTILKSI